MRVIADEIHAPIVAAGTEFVPYLSVSGTANAFALQSASKAWNLAGLKAAVALAGPGRRLRHRAAARGGCRRGEPRRRHGPHRRAS